MTGREYTAPTYDTPAFNCPFCGAFAHQNWATFEVDLGNEDYIRTNLEGTQCAACREWAVWKGEKLVYPNDTSTPLPSSDMPQDVAEDFREAREVLGVSPRSSAALLRLALQKLCKHLGQKGENINQDIGALVAAGKIAPQVQKALDYVRIVGNNAVHPGELDLRDDIASAETLFRLLNHIVDETITRPREIDKLFETLPEGAREQIVKRDKKAKTS